MSGTEIKINLNKYQVDGEVVVVNTGEKRTDAKENTNVDLAREKNIRCLFEDLPIKRVNSRIMR